MANNYWSHFKFIIVRRAIGLQLVFSIGTIIFKNKSLQSSWQSVELNLLTSRVRASSWPIFFEDSLNLLLHAEQLGCKQSFQQEQSILKHKSPQRSRQSAVLTLRGSRVRGSLGKIFSGAILNLLLYAEQFGCKQSSIKEQLTVKHKSPQRSRQSVSQYLKQIYQNKIVKKHQNSNTE